MRELKTVAVVLLLVVAVFSFLGTRIYQKIQQATVKNEEALVRNEALFALRTDLASHGAKIASFGDATNTGYRELVAIDRDCNIIPGPGISMREARAFMAGWTSSGRGRAWSCVRQSDGVTVSIPVGDLMPAVTP